MNEELLLRKTIKKNNVVGIGHNNSEYSKEQFAKLLNHVHKAHRFAQQEMRRVRKLFDEAFTKQVMSNPYERKLKDFEIHERRIDAGNIASKYISNVEAHIESIEKKAKADNIELELNKEEESNG